MKIYDAHYIGGEWVAAGPGRLEVHNAATEAVIARVPAGSAEDADRAVRAARAAFDSWAGTPPADAFAAMTAAASRAEGAGAGD